MSDKILIRSILRKHRDGKAPEAGVPFSESEMDDIARGAFGREVLSISTNCHLCGEAIHHEIPPPKERVTGVIRCGKCGDETLFEIEPKPRGRKP